MRADESEEARGYRGWRVVAAGSFLQFLQAGLLHLAFGAYVSALAQEKSWSKTSLSLAASMKSAEAALLGPVLGWWMDRHGPRSMMRAGVLLLGGGFVLLSQIETMVGFFVAVGVLAVGSSLAGFFPTNLTIVTWFRRQRVRALSWVALGLALGGVCMPAVSWFMQTFGWRATALCSGVLIVLLGYPLTSGFQKRRTGTDTVRVAGVGEPPPDAALAPEAGEAGLLTRQAFRTHAFWLLSLSHGCALLVVTAINVHAVSHVRESLGYSLAQAGWVIAGMTVAQIGGVALGWLVGDRANKRWLCAVCMLMHGAGLLALTYASDLFLIALFCVLHGVAWGLRGPLMHALRAEYFGLRAIGAITGAMTIISAIGQVGGPMVAGSMYDLSGSYRLGFVILAALAFAGACMFLMARTPHGVETNA